MSYRWFDDLANSVTVRDVMQRVLPLSVDSDKDRFGHLEVNELLRDPLLLDVDAALVDIDGAPRLWSRLDPSWVYKITHEDASPKGAGDYICTVTFRCPINEITIPLSARDFITADTTLLQAINIFSKTREDALLFVIDRTEIIGSVTFDRIARSFAFRTCMLALVLGIEERALELLMHDHEASFDDFPNRRKQKSLNDLAQQISLVEVPDDEELLEANPQLQVGWYYSFDSPPDTLFGPHESSETAAEKAREGEELKVEVLARSLFADKKEMIAKRAKRGEFGSDWSATRTLKVMEAAERMRNHCAHPDPGRSAPESLGDASACWGLVRDIVDLTARIDSQIDEIVGKLRSPDLRIVSSPTVT